MGISPDCVKGFLKFFTENPPTFSNSPDRFVKIAGKRYAYDQFDSMKKILSPEAVLKYRLGEWWDMEEADRMDFLTNYIEGNFRQELIEKRKNQEDLKAKMRSNGKASLELPDAEYILIHLQPFRVLGDKRREAGVLFLDSTTKQVTDYDFFSIQSALKAGGIEKGTVEAFLNQILHVREVYDPHNHQNQVRKIEDTNAVYEVNRYIAPSWKGKTFKPRLDEDIDRLCRHLFPGDECREYVFTWIYHSLTSRAGTYLYLCGGQGSGKNTLASLVAALHGLSNTSLPKQDSLMGRFNHYLKYKRFIFFDEFNCRNRRDKDILKLMINDRIQIEGKGRDHEDIDVYASYMVANNSLEAIGLDPVDRRFSVPNVNHDSIIPVFGREWIERFTRRVKEDETFVGEFGTWILENFKKPRWSKEEPYQKERFEEIVLATARFGIAELIGRILKKTQNSYDYYEEREAFRRVHKGTHYPPIQDWMKFFQEVKHGGRRLGTVDGKTFTPREEFQARPGEREVMG
ncbi:MAG: hypothetical protein E6R04_04870 [Spirochaetes bacterium]|nr:MAG: hypothetical protein E6R04_04870 [Spirochaetota bacterium]